MFRSLTMANRPDRIEICGNMVIASTVYMTIMRPRNCTRPSAYAANDPTTNEASTVTVATIDELNIVRMKSLSPNRFW